MKNNTELVKDLLQKALKNAPNDFALQEVRLYIRKAIEKIEHVENKREKREEKEKKEVVQPIYNPHAIEILDKMLGEEQEKLNQIIAKKGKNVPIVQNLHD